MQTFSLPSTFWVRLGSRAAFGSCLSLRSSQSTCNKSSPQNQPLNDSRRFTPSAPTNVNVAPPFSNYYSTTQVAKIIGVDRATVLYWRKKGIFVEDFVKHHVYLYSHERVMQLKSVYHKDWTRGGYMPSPTTSDYDEKQSRINETVKLFNILYGKITAPHFAYLWTKQRGIFSFNIADSIHRTNMAKKAVQLSSIGVDVWHSVNTVCIEPADGKVTKPSFLFKLLSPLKLIFGVRHAKATLLFLPLTLTRRNFSFPLLPA